MSKVFCKRCGKKFERQTKSTKLCEKCKRKAFLIGYKKRMETIKKKLQLNS